MANPLGGYSCDWTGTLAWDATESSGCGYP